MPPSDSDHATTPSAFSVLPVSPRRFMMCFPGVGALVCEAAASASNRAEATIRSLVFFIVVILSCYAKIVFFALGRCCEAE